LLSLLLSANCLFAVVPKFKAPEVPDFSRYQGILKRMPFGAPPPAGGEAQTSAADARTAAQELKEQQMLARKINMSCVNITPSGRAAVGFTDLSTKPPVNYYILVGDEAGGWTLKSADYDEEWAELERDGTTIYVKLGQGLMAEPPPSAEKIVVAEQSAKQKKSTPIEKPAGDEETERVILTPEEHFVQHESFELLDGIPNPVSPPGNLSEQEQAEIVATRREMLKARRSGQDTTSYRERLQAKLEQAQKKQEERDQATTLELKRIAEQVAVETLEERLKQVDDLLKE